MKEAINAAISAHGLWKARLKAAIETGKIDIPVETIRMDDQCAFGKWLYGRGFPEKSKNSPHYERVIELHATFHEAAARVVELALQGRKEEAKTLIRVKGEFAAASVRLMDAMREWKEEAEKEGVDEAFAGFAPLRK